MDGVKQYSLRLHLLSLISIPIILAGCVIGSFAMWSAYHEISEVYDAQLSHAAKVLLQLTEHEVKEHESYEIELGAERPDISHRYEKNISFRIWKGSHLVTESVSAKSFENINAPPDFSDQKISDELWRFFVFVDHKTGITVEVAERYKIRTELIVRILGSFFAPALLFVPLSLLLIWLGTTRSLKPLLDVSAAVDKRDAGDLAPIDAQRIPKEVMPIIRALNRLLRRLDTGLRREREFTDNAAHELRTPLAAMKTQTQVLQKKAGNMPECKDGLNSLHASIDRAAHMVDQLLSFSRMQSRDLEFEDIDISVMTQDILKELSPLAVAKKQECEADIVPAIHVTGNKDALAIMVRNLIDNAIKYTPEKGQITVSLEKDGVLTVTDTGPGIPDSEKDKVLERFSRGNTKSEGSGLGLAMVKWACDLHDAKLSLTDNRPKGLIVAIKMAVLS
ncbi:MAG: sensor histidine kinase N-terminal domain-containing protein [Rhodospirillales bacterium]|nr:sensor histidine kinase N-terminal domain-containing protein [Rhodospirillales bacterium]MCB9996889.1 sensor histidine kinase N-terminal domain-containing protein [Rhodospirillales bacterium]